MTHLRRLILVLAAALTAAAAGMSIAVGLTWRFKLGHHRVLDFTPSLAWAPPVLAENPEPMGNFGIVSKHVVAVSIAGQPEPLIDGPQNDTNYLALGDPAASTSIREIAPESSPSL